MIYKAILKKIEPKESWDNDGDKWTKYVFVFDNGHAPLVYRTDVLYYKDEYDWDGTLGVCLGDKTMFNWKKSIMLIRNDRCI